MLNLIKNIVGDPKSNNSNNNRLTEQAYWNNYWNKIPLPLEIKRSKNALYINEILNIFDEYLPKNDNLSILEIGGAPGQYLAYMHKNFGHKINSLDYSPIGCTKTKENFNLLNIPVNVYQKDIFLDDLDDLPLFDIVYSLGFIEHFLDLNAAIQKHVKLLKPGGILLLGVPNLLGINHFFLKRLSPKLLSTHNLSIMDISNWKNFEDDFNLKIIFKGYVGGFEPSLFNRWENKTIFNGVLKVIAYGLTCIFSRHFKIFRKFNSKYTSSYAMGVYKNPKEGL